MPDVSEILQSVPPTAGSFAPAAEALGQPMNEGDLGDPQVNGEHVLGHVGLQDLLAGKLGDNIVKAADKADARDISPAVAGLGHVESVVNKHIDKVDSSVKNIFNDEPAKPNFKEQLSPEAHEDLTTKIKNFANNPVGMIDELSEATLPLHAVAPQIASSAQQTATRAVQFLASKIPPTNPGPLNDEHAPSNTEIANFSRYLNIVQDPTKALSEIKDGTLTPETVETIATVYPKLYNHMKQSIISNLNPDISFQKKMGLSQFLGEPLDSSLAANRVMSLQSSFAPFNAREAAQKTSMQKAPASGLSKITLAQRTSLQPKDNE